MRCRGLASGLPKPRRLPRRATRRGNRRPMSVSPTPPVQNTYRDPGCPVLLRPLSYLWVVPISLVGMFYAILSHAHKTLLPHISRFFSHPPTRPPPAPRLSTGTRLIHRPIHRPAAPDALRRPHGTPGRAGPASAQFDRPRASSRKPGNINTRVDTQFPPSMRASRIPLACWVQVAAVSGAGVTWPGRPKWPALISVIMVRGVITEIYAGQRRCDVP